jgi:hypothetical protein
VRWAGPPGERGGEARGLHFRSTPGKAASRVRPLRSDPAATEAVLRLSDRGPRPGNAALAPHQRPARHPRLRGEREERLRPAPA